jgi:hypothetical protein
LRIGVVTDFTTTDFSNISNLFFDETFSPYTIMSITTVDTPAESKATTIRINDDYKWIQYNEDLRLLHSIKDDMYQGQSIIKALGVEKRFRDWLANDQTKELIEGVLGVREFPRTEKLTEDRPHLANELKGWYVHRLLVNFVAMWASPTYAYKIALLLDTVFANQRKELEAKIEEMKPRTVPKKKEKSYKYMIYHEDFDDNQVILHLVRRNQRTFDSEMKAIQNSDKCLFFRENLPVAMTPNEDIKDIVRNLLPNPQYRFNMSKIYVPKDYLTRIVQRVTEYFSKIHE